MVAPGDGTAIFNVSVFILLALEIVGCLLGTIVLGGRKKNNKSTSRLNSKLSGRSSKLFSSRASLTS